MGSDFGCYVVRYEDVVALEFVVFQVFYCVLEDVLPIAVSEKPAVDWSLAW